MADQESNRQAEPAATSRTDASPAPEPVKQPASFIPLTTLQSASPPRLDLAAIRERLAGTRGRQYWRSLEELADTEEFQRYVQREFAIQTPAEMAPLNRREFFRVMGATLALAGVAGCSYQPPEKIVPYVEQPEQIVPGKPLYFATAFQRGGYAHGVLAENQMGRPVKLEGNPDHPASQGATDTFTQASLLTLYDPDRSQAVRHFGDLTAWDVFLGTMTDQLETIRRNRGAGLRLLTGTITSPTLASQIRKLLAQYPEARVHQHEPVGRESVRDGARLAFGDEVNPVYHFAQAETILSLDSDFLADEPGSVRYARDFIDGRRVRAAQTKMNRLYVVESTPTLTGAMADHHLRLRPSLIESVARAIASGLGVGAAGAATAPPAGVPPKWIAALVKDLQGHRGTSLVIAGPHQSPAVQALAFAMNQALGNVGKSVSFTAPIESHFGGREGTLRELVDDMKAGRVETLVILDSNPAYSVPADLDFAASMQKVPLRIHHGQYDDETGVLCQWHIPESHYLEAWSDARAYDGTTSLIQPLILPLYETRSAHEVLAVLLGEGDRYGYDIVREYWQSTDPRFTVPATGGGTARTATPNGAAGVPLPAAPRTPSPAFEKWWHEALLKGVIPGTAAPPRPVTLKPNLASAMGSAPAAASTGIEIIFRPDPSIGDGRFSNNAWLQEIPKPLTSLTWDNAALISPAMAEAQHLSNDDLVDLRYRGQTLTAAVRIMPGHPDNAVTLHLGYGRKHAGRLGSGMGFNAYALLTSDSPWFGTGVELTRAGGSYHLVAVQHHFSMHGRDFVRTGTNEEFVRSQESKVAPEFMHKEEDAPITSLYPPMWPSDRKPTVPGLKVPLDLGTYEAKGYEDKPIPAWGMVIDQNACIGCNACTLACQAENNIATVGKDEVDKHREMHWIRVDVYYTGSLEDPEAVFEPVPCMHCEKAPCEPVCPVEATTHSAEGLNEQTYNRCVGTRYCQNNCPYKVRRFNYLQYSDQESPLMQMMANPDVTVRSRGVMEKCTYCVQRINEARIQAEKEDRPIRDGDVVTACQQVCPTRAIFFGDTNDTQSNGGKGSIIRQLKQEPLNYTLIAELNTRPRTSYLAKLRNPNPEMGTVRKEGTG